jgi:hypothetical protein
LCSRFSIALVIRIGKVFTLLLFFILALDPLYYGTISVQQWSINCLIVVLSRNDESLAKGDVIPSEQVDKGPLAQFTRLRVLYRLLQSHDDPIEVIGVRVHNVQVSFLVDGRVV